MAAPRTDGIAYPWRHDALSLLVSIGAELIHFRVDRDDLALTEIGRLTLPAAVQYVWPHPERSLLYVASSNRSISKADDRHALSTVALDEDSGQLREIAQVPLPTRPIHLTLNRTADIVLVVYNAPATITTHRIAADGRAGPTLPQSATIDAGVFPHQVRMLPSGDAAVIVARGNHARGESPEAPGSLRFVSMRDGMLGPLATVAPNGGHGFGPRHLDFHPGGRWAAVSLERQNELQIFEVLGDRFADTPAHRITTLHAPSNAEHDQLSGTLRFDASGRFLYVVNRHDPAVYGSAGDAADLAGNNLAVYAFDAASGRAEPIQHAPTESVHVRTFSLDASGTLLVTASILPALARSEDGTLTKVPARLTFFRVETDGRLTRVHVHDMPESRFSMFWSRLFGTM